MPNKYPLGRIHPHGSGGKSVYQQAFQNCQGFSLFGLLLGGSMLVGGLVLALSGLVYGTFAVGAGLGIAYAGALCASDELEKVPIPNTGYEDSGSRNHFSEADKDFLEELELLASKFEEATNAGEWQKVIGLGLIFKQLLDHHWAPFIEYGHPDRDADSILALSGSIDRDTMLNRCHYLFTVGIRKLTPEQRAAVDGKQFHYDTGTGELGFL